LISRLDAHSLSGLFFKLSGGLSKFIANQVEVSTADTPEKAVTPVMAVTPSTAVTPEKAVTPATAVTPERAARISIQSLP